MAANPPPRLPDNNPQRRSRSAYRGDQASRCACCTYHNLYPCSHTSCELAQYFPAAMLNEYTNVVSVFGRQTRSLILKKLEGLTTPQEKQHYISSIIFEANVRAENPVGGCFDLIQNLQRQLNYYRDELARANSMQQDRNQDLDVNALDLQLSVNYASQDRDQEDLRVNVFHQLSVHYKEDTDPVNQPPPSNYDDPLLEMRLWWL